jgi:hypothetical protein
MDYIYPFSTCEKKRDGLIAQPFSFTINIISAVILLCFAYYVKNKYLKVLFCIYALFQLWHSLSHVIHLEGRIQYHVSHSLALLMIFFTLITILALAHKSLTTLQSIIIMSLFILDIVLHIFYKNNVISITSGLSLFIIMMIMVYPILPPMIKKYLPLLILGVILIIILFIIESKYCHILVEKFPFHVLVEITGLILFTSLAYLMLYEL